MSLKSRMLLWSCVWLTQGLAPRLGLRKEINGGTLTDSLHIWRAPQNGELITLFRALHNRSGVISNTDYDSKRWTCFLTLSLSTVFCEVLDAMEMVSGWLLPSPWLSPSSPPSLIINTHAQITRRSFGNTLILPECLKIPSTSSVEKKGIVMLLGV